MEPKWTKNERRRGYVKKKNSLGHFFVHFSGVLDREQRQRERGGSRQPAAAEEQPKTRASPVTRNPASFHRSELLVTIRLSDIPTVGDFPNLISRISSTAYATGSCETV